MKLDAQSKQEEWGDHKKDCTIIAQSLSFYYGMKLFFNVHFKYKLLDNLCNSVLIVR